MDEPLLQIEAITKSFGNTPVLKGINLAIGKGEFITLLGSSGCGKTTTLRIIAGLEEADSGRILLNGQDITGAEPNRRDVNTVFQNYALFPHMTVSENIGYGLKVKKRSKSEIQAAVAGALELVQMQEFKERFPSELSGGQRQRVAIARAVVNNPAVLLLDEPLGALDLHLRRQMQLELKRLQKQLGITFVYITHDQEEALNMSDRICVMRDGVFEQIGTPSEIYDHPQTAYVARFVGEANIVCGRVKSLLENDILLADCAGGCVPVQANGFCYQVGDPIAIAVRSEHIEFAAANCAHGGLNATVCEKSFAGSLLRIVLTLQNGKQMIASRHGINANLCVQDAIRICWKPENAVAVQAEDDALCNE